MVMLGFMDPPSETPIQPVTQQESVDSLVAQSASEARGFAMGDSNNQNTQSDVIVNTAHADGGSSGAPQSAEGVDLAGVTADTIIVETKLFTVKLSTFGGGPISIKLKKFNYAYGDKEPIEMISDSKRAEPQISFTDGAFNLSELSYTHDRASNRIDAQSSEQRITFSYTSPTGGVIEKHYTFYPDRYSYDLETVVPDRRVFGFERDYEVLWGTALKATEQDKAGDYNSSFAMALFPGGPTTFGSTGIPFFGNDWEDGKFKVSETDDVQWMGIRTKYFTATLIPRSGPGERAVAHGLRLLRRKATVIVSHVNISLRVLM